MCDTVNIAMGYSAVLGAESFASLDMTDNSLRALDQVQVKQSQKVLFDPLSQMIADRRLKIDLEPSVKCQLLDQVVERASS